MTLEAIIAIVIATTVVVRWIVERCIFWRQRRQYINEHKEFIDQLEQFDATYSPEKPDIECALKCKEYLDTMFPEGIREKVSKMSKEERLRLFAQIEKDVEGLLDVNIDSVDFYTDANPPENMYCGYYRHEDNSFHINADFIQSSDSELIEEQIFTIFHELKHARQWQAVLNEHDYGYSKELLCSWAENFQNYIPPCISDELYRKQPVEMDTFGFESFLKGEISVEELV